LFFFFFFWESAGRSNLAKDGMRSIDPLVHGGDQKV
jgi:hypothetical protein